MHHLRYLSPTVHGRQLLGFGFTVKFTLSSLNMTEALHATGGASNLKIGSLRQFTVNSQLPNWVRAWIGSAVTQLLAELLPYWQESTLYPHLRPSGTESAPPPWRRAGMLA